MTKRTLPSQEYLRQCFDYDPLTGVLRRRFRPREHFSTDRIWRIANAKFAGKVFGTLSDLGYIVGTLDTAPKLRAHRIIWKMVHNEEPPEIDHKNRTRNDNRLDNLRAATSSQNRCNRVYADRTVPFRGILPNGKRWAARIRVDGKYKSLGTHDTPEQAHAAYRAAATANFGDFAVFE